MLRRLLLIFSLALAMCTTVFITAASASTMISTLVSDHHAEIVQAVSLLLGYAASHVTAFLTHDNAPPRVKTTIAFLLSAVAGVVSTVVWSAGEPWYLWVKAIGLAFLSSQAAYLTKDLPVIGSGLLQNVGLNIGDPDAANSADPTGFPGASDDPSPVQIVDAPQVAPQTG